MKNIEKEVARILLEKKAVTLNVEEPYTYVSGIRSPIYCDNRLLNFFPEEREIIVKGFVDIIREMNPEIIAGTATGAISWGAWIAAELKKPFVYIRKQSKDYGRAKLIEGGDINGKKVVVIEDLASTGGSSMNAVESTREAGAEVLAMVGIFTYNLKKATEKFEAGNCKTVFLTNFDILAQVAAENNFIDEESLNMVLDWNKNPGEWGPKHGFPLGEQKN